MIFCGQCGLQVAPGVKQCPRCGASTEVGSTVGWEEELHTNDSTVVSLSQASDTPWRPVVSPKLNDPHKLILPSPQGYDDYGTTQGTYQPPARMGDAYNYRVQAPRVPASIRPGALYPAIGPSQHQSAKGRVAALVIILLGLVLILSAMVLFALQHRIGGL